MKILMVCLGNVCRSPLAHGILEHLAHKNNLDWTIDSCGTGGYHNGEGPNPNSIRVAKMHQIDISAQISREMIPTELKDWDIICAMDQQNYNTIRKHLNEAEVKQKLRLLMNFAYPTENRTIPDPWYDHKLYEPVYDMIYEACEGIIEAYSKQ